MMPEENNWKRTLFCGEAGADGLIGTEDGEKTVVNGWVYRMRNHGDLCFINLRDRSGILQVVAEPPGEEAAASEKAGYDALCKAVESVKIGYCLSVTGRLRERPEAMRNPEMKTGGVELKAENIRILNTSPPLPFNIAEESEAGEALRLKYRYLDLRSAGMQERLGRRHEVFRAIRSYLNDRRFWEIETPTLIKGTPEGARDFLVPSRNFPGKFYALPQSPQLYKQLLMAGGCERYYQFPRCYRDEDMRGDRQPEFTQLDVEMSFVSQEDVLELTEGMMRFVVTELSSRFPSGGRKIGDKDTGSKEAGRPFGESSFPRLSSEAFPRFDYEEALNRYGSDRPDLRFDLLLRDFSRTARETEFRVFQKALEDSGTGAGCVKVLAAPGCAETMTRKKIDALEKTARQKGAAGLAWAKVGPEAFEGGISRFLNPLYGRIVEETGAAPGDVLFFTAGAWKTAVLSLGAVRSALGKELGLIRPDELAFCWVLNFPLFGRDEETGALVAEHHLFSAPKEEDLPFLESDPERVKGSVYDLVLNGCELGSGSIRIHNADLQKKVFGAVNFSAEEAEEQFGFLLEAFRFGAPPHGGIALGMDRLVMILSGRDSIRDVMAFPKTLTGHSPLENTPASADPEALKELHLTTRIEDPGDSADSAKDGGEKGS